MAETKSFFANAETDSKFEAVLGIDKTVSIPGKYSGKLSNIPPEIAQMLVDMEDNQVKVRKVPIGKTPASEVKP